MKLFDLSTAPLEGRNLIESSAGTGKTYAISSLYVRLLLERLLPVKQILVVTFTEAATADLKRKVREKISETINALQGRSSADAFAVEFANRFRNNSESLELLFEALHSFDEAAIFTIHGFCHRVLQENAFESSVLFETELQTTQDALLQEIVDDFWRMHLYPRSALLHRYLHHVEFTSLTLFQFAQTVISHSFLRVIPDLTPPDGEALESHEQSLQSALAEVIIGWQSTRDEVEGFLLHHEGLKRNIYRADWIQKWLKEMDCFIALEDPFDVPKCFRRFCTSGLKEGINPRKNSSLSHLSFFDQAERFNQIRVGLSESYDKLLLGLQVKLAGFVRQELKRRKRERNIRSFDDLLLDLHEALQGSQGETLAQAIGGKYRAILIDEFQDTDSLQYAIFDKICSHTGSLLCLIGDPKQAIYGFRGADVFAYLQAASQVSSVYTLEKNWRSAPNLIRAVNAVFQRTPSPFVFPQIAFSAVRSGNEEAAEGLLWEGKPDAMPLKLWLKKRGNPDDLPISKGEAEKELPEAVASEIVRLLDASARGKVQVEGVPLSPRHIAVLVRTNREARLVQVSLQKRRIPSVLYSSESVFSSEEALELELLLTGIIGAGNETRVKAALATAILGINGNELARLGEDDPAWDEWLRTFTSYREIWLNEGFMNMASTLMNQQSVRSRLLALPNGERRLTNLLQILELLHEAVLTDQLGLDGVLKWLIQHRQEDRPAPAQEHQLRLETDESAVRVVTVHKSKGLEYPVVFCPFCWNSYGGNDNVTFHDPADWSVVIRDLGSSEQERNRLQAQKETLAENARLLYVALTRAQYRAYLAWGPIKGAGQSALARLLHPREGELSLGEFEAYFEILTDETVESDLRDLALQSGQTIDVLPVPTSSQQLYQPPLESESDFVCRRFTGEVPYDWGISSYTALVSGRRRDIESPDRDSQPERESLFPRGSGMSRPFRLTPFDFPKGSRAGSLLHEVLQYADFSVPNETNLIDLVREKLRAYGFNLEWEKAVCQMVFNALSTPLGEGVAAWRLGDLSADDRLHEMEFNFPLDLLTSQKLAGVWRTLQPQQHPLEFPDVLDQLEFSPVRGWMKGFIDLVFCHQGRYYLADWKSNFLGDQPEAYHQGALRTVMEQNHYILQYLLYTVALCRFLAFRIPDFRYEEHFGGVYYFFLRGLDPVRDSEHGVYFDRPSEAVIRRMSQLLSKSPLENQWAWNSV